MTVKDQLNEALKNAMKDHDEEKKLTYRMALAAIKFAEKEGQKEVSDEEALELVQREIKIRREQIEVWSMTLPLQLVSVLGKSLNEMFLYFLTH